MKSIYFARRMARMAWAKKAEDVIIMDMRALTDVNEFLVICTGSVGMHVRAIIDFIVDESKILGQRPFITEKDSDGWMIVDYVDVTFHCFQPARRMHFNLEKLWCDALFMRLNSDNGKIPSLKASRDVQQTIASEV